MTGSESERAYQFVLGLVEARDREAERSVSPEARTVMRYFGIRRAVDLGPPEWAMAQSMGIVPRKTP